MGDEKDKIPIEKIDGQVQIKVFSMGYTPYLGGIAFNKPKLADQFFYIVDKTSYLCFAYSLSYEEETRGSLATIPCENLENIPAIKAFLSQ